MSTAGPEAPIGRRERKKAATRQAIADAALRLFLAHGYEQVSVKQVAEAADVALATLFKHFPSKEALVFDQDDAQEAELLDAVRSRDRGEPVLVALRRYMSRFVSEEPTPELVEFLDMVNRTAALRDFEDRKWLLRRDSLAAAIAEELNRPDDDATIGALALFVLNTMQLTRDRPTTGERLAALDAGFDLLESGFHLEPSRE